MNSAAITLRFHDGRLAAHAADLPSALRGWLVALSSEPLAVEAKPAAEEPEARGQDAEDGIASDVEPATGPAAAVDAVDWADIQASLGGDDDAFARLVRRYQPDIARYVRRFTRHNDSWEELVHEVFVEAYFGLRKFAGRAPLLHWLKRIATRTGYRHWQQRSRRARETTLAGAAAELVADSDGGVETRLAAELVHSLLAKLAPRDRLVMTLMYLEQCGVADIARLTGWSESMVKVQAHRARKRLRRICRQAGIQP